MCYTMYIMYSPLATALHFEFQLGISCNNKMITQLKDEEFVMIKMYSLSVVKLIHCSGFYSLVNLVQ